MTEDGFNQRVPSRVTMTHRTNVGASTERSRAQEREDELQHPDGCKQ